MPYCSDNHYPDDTGNHYHTNDPYNIFQLLHTDKLVRLDYWELVVVVVRLVVVRVCLLEAELVLVEFLKIHH
jgi:hypothetical protein